MSRRLAADQFLYLWEELGADGMPYPLQQGSTAKMKSEYEARRVELVRWRGALADPGLLSLLTLLRHPEICMRVSVVDGEARPLLRMIGASRQGNGVVVEQLPGAEMHQGGDVLLFDGPGHELPGSIMQALAAVGPGRHPDISAYVADVDSTESGSIMQPVTTSVAKRVRALLARPREATGFIVMTGPAGDVPGVMWIDVAGDGRYIVRRDERTVRVTPASPNDIYAELLHQVDQAQPRKQTFSAGGA